ncbi:MAG: ABC transporter ATP-binding protein [Pseudomonadota bacterium]
MSTVLDIANLSVTFAAHGGPVEAVREVDLSIGAGETVALVGESGSGKSVTARAVLRLLPESARVQCDSMHFEGAPIDRLRGDALQQLRGGGIGMVFQEPMTALNPLHTVEKQVAETLVLHQRLSVRRARARTLELLDRVGIENGFERLASYPHELSGGQRQRVMIAMALANTPRLLIADEPTTALDVTVESQILELLRSLQAELGMAILLISHDLGVVRHMASKTAVMREGTIVEHGATTAVFGSPQHPYTRHLVDAEPAGTPAPVPADAETVLTCDRLNTCFVLRRSLFGRSRVTLQAVDEVSLQVRQGETLGIVGESGSGKSTLAQCLLRLVPFQSGRVSFEGTAIETQSQASLRPLRQRMQMVFQDPFGALSPRMSVGQIIGEGLAVHAATLDADARDARVAQALAEVELDPAVRDRYPHEFSGGQRQRIAIARALVLHPRLLVLDEPTSALDRSVQAQVLDLLRDLQQRHNLAFLFISHDLKVVRAISHRVVVMRSGRVVEQGDTEAIFTRPAEAYTQRLLAAATERDRAVADVSV